ncbi:MAG TPA: ABC transporter permease [Acidimicrobiales bacterium]|nr:ABC transporter permease [Acidimicrobiales bacterium]
MIRISLISLWARRRRLMGTTLAVFLGVAFLSGTLVLGDTLSANFDRLFAEVSAGTDVVVRSDSSISNEDDIDGGRAPLDQSLVSSLASVDGVDVAEGQVVGYGALADKDGEPVGGNGPPRLAGSWIDTPGLNPYELAEGRAPETSDEVVVNRGAAELADVSVGDTAVVQTPEPVEVTVVGISTFGGTDGLGQTTWTAFTLEGAQEHVTKRPDEVSTILLQADDGVSSAELRSRVDRALPDGVEAITGADLAGERTDAISAEFLDMLRTFLVVFAGIALVVATLSIANTFSITVAQRTRELALVRAVGASRRQLRRTVAIEALGIGLVASVAGVVAGVGVAATLKGVFDAFGFALPAGGLEIKPLSMTAAFVVGVTVTYIAARSAARRAASLAPVEAMRDAAVEPSALGRVRLVLGSVVGVGGVALTLVGASADAVVLTGVGAVGMVVATLLLAPAGLSPVAGVLGGGLRRLRGVNGMLAEQNARRNPRRSAATATALVVGVAVVALFTVFAASTKQALAEQVADDFAADLAVSTPSFGGGRLSPELASELSSMDEVAGVVGLGGGAADVDGSNAQVTATSPGDLTDVGGIEPLAGSFDSVGDDGIAISETRADDEGWSLGSSVELAFVDGARESVEVRAIYPDNSLLGGLVVDDALWDAHNVQPADTTVLVDVASGVSIDDAKAAITPVADSHGGDVQDGSELAATAGQGLDLLLGVVYVLLALAVVIALLGIGNTLSLAVHERRRELGLLRAVGQTRRQVRSVLRLESVIVALFGTVVGLVLGSYLGWALFATLWTDGSGGFTLPILRLLVIAVMGALAGVLAARRPARRAARTPILEAIAST